MEKNYKEDQSRDDTIRLTIKSLLEVVQTGAKNIEITVMESYGKTTVSPGLPRSDACVSDSYLLATSPRALHIYRSSKMRRSRRLSSRSKLKRRPRPNANVPEPPPSLRPLPASVGIPRLSRLRLVATIRQLDPPRRASSRRTASDLAFESSRGGCTPEEIPVNDIMTM